MQIDINERERRAMDLFKEGHNCSQSVALAFSDIIAQKQGLTEDQIRAVTSGFGGGFGRLREVCGTVSGMTFVAGAVCPAPASGLAGSSSEVSTQEQHLPLTREFAQRQKAANYELVQSLANSFREENGSIICRELLEIRANAVKGQSANPAQLASMQSTNPSPAERTPEYYKARPCEQLVGIAARILATKLNEIL